MILEIAGLALLVFVAAFFIVPALGTSRRQAAQKQWPRVKGVVTAQRVRMRGNTGFPEVRVRFRAGEREREEWVGSGDGLGYTHYDINGRVRRAVDQKMARRPAGSPIEVMISPADDAEVFLVERELPARLIAMVLAAIFLTFLLLFSAIAFGWV